MVTFRPGQGTKPLPFASHRDHAGRGKRKPEEVVTGFRVQTDDPVPRFLELLDRPGHVDHPRNRDQGRSSSRSLSRD